MPEKVEVEVFIMMDAEGYVAVAGDKDGVRLAFTTDIGRPTLPVRITKHIALMTPPAVQNGPTVEIPDEAAEMETEAA